MRSNRGLVPLSYHPIGRADLGVITGLELEPEQIEHYLGPLPEIQAAVRRGPAHCMTGIVADGALVGFYVLHPDRRDNACWWLGWLAVDCRQQGRGYGRVAMAHILLSLRRIVGCRRIRLLVDPINTRAVCVYARAGFHQVGVHASGELIMELVLTSAVVIRDIVAALRASSVSKRARRAGRLRLSPGPHAGLVIGVERGPPEANRISCSGTPMVQAAVPQAHRVAARRRTGAARYQARPGSRDQDIAGRTTGRVGRG